MATITASTDPVAVVWALEARTAYTNVVHHLRQGAAHAVIDKDKVKALGIEGISIVKGYIEDMLQQSVTISMNSLGDLEVFPEGLMQAQPMADTFATSTNSSPGTTYSSSPKVSVPTTTKSAGKKNRAKADKIPRPPNAFILYRKHLHPIEVAHNPGLHNNDISVIIGKKWRAESQEIRDEYKRMAEEVKKQHEQDHPEYQYQPRKPSEKKRRMTKNKMAKQQAELNSQVSDNTEHHGREKRRKVTNVEVADYHEPPAQVIHVEHPKFLKINSGHDDHGQLTTQLLQHNAQFLAQPNAATNANTNFFGYGAGPAIAIATPLVNGQPEAEPELWEDPNDLKYRFLGMTRPNNVNSNAATCNPSAIHAGSNAVPGIANSTTVTDNSAGTVPQYNESAEVERQYPLSFEWEDFVNFDLAFTEDDLAVAEYNHVA